MPIAVMCLPVMFIGFTISRGIIINDMKTVINSALAVISYILFLVVIGV